MGEGVSKQFLPILGVPAVARALLAFERARTVRHTVVVCRREERERMERCVRKYGAGKVVSVVTGGETRQESVSAGVAAAPREDGFLAVHDGARPLVLPEEIDACVRDAFRTGASALGTPLKDTVKRIDPSGLVVSTPRREGLWAVQTPQVFERGLYLRALERAAREGADYTDDCQLVEHIGGAVHLCRGSCENIKLTTSEDVPAAEAVLCFRGGKEMKIGQGYDVHRLAEGRRLVLGGVEIPFQTGLLGHSDADVLVHAVMDALLGAAALGDIGTMFPDDNPAFRDADSLGLLEAVCGRLRQNGYRIVNIDSTVAAQAPRLSPHIPAMRKNIAGACGIPVPCVSVKATTEEHLGFTGSGEGVSARAVCLIDGDFPQGMP